MNLRVVSKLLGIVAMLIGRDDGFQLALGTSAARTSQGSRHCRIRGNSRVPLTCGEHADQFSSRLVANPIRRRDRNSLVP